MKISALGSSRLLHLLFASQLITEGVFYLPHRRQYEELEHVLGFAPRHTKERERVGNAHTKDGF
jgi:hypothetical protein